MPKKPSNIPSAKTLVTTAASIAASAMLVRSMTRDLVPHELRHYFFFKIQSFVKSFSPDVVLIIEEFNGLVPNQIYKAAEFYLGFKISPNTRVLKVTMPEKENSLVTTMAKNQEVIDTFNGAQFKWLPCTKNNETKRIVYQQNTTIQQETKYFQLTFHKKHKEMVFNSYFPFILSESKRLREDKKTLKIYTLNSESLCGYSLAENSWNSVNLDHPSTFETLAMDGDLKREIMEDLETFVKRREFYRRVGKAWKRGYLLYGPPGTGKSSLIAAMANYLKFDIYDLELTDIRENSQLRRLLIATANRSMLVIEDIDCSLDLDEDRMNQKMRKEEGSISKKKRMDCGQAVVMSVLSFSQPITKID
ncbi:hypothetical protein LguiB_022270 [Lonicera macranthoides]